MFRLLSFAAAVSANAGLSAAVTQEGLTEAKTIITPYIFQNLNDIEVPEVDFDGGYLKNIKVTVPQPALTDVNVNLVDASNGVELLA